MAKLSKAAFGSKANIETAKTNGVIDQFDILYLDDGEFGWLDKSGNTVLHTPRIQEDINVPCVNSVDETNGNKIAAGKTLDEAVKIIAQSILPKVKEETLQSAKDYADQISGGVVEVVEF